MPDDPAPAAGRSRSRSKPVRRLNNRLFKLTGASVALAVTLLSPLSSPSAASQSAGVAPRPRIVDLKPCPNNAVNLCGAIRVPLYWLDPQEGSITVGFEEFLHTDRAVGALEPIVAIEGGPGYPSIESAGSYRFMLGPLLERHDLILMDQRGTGVSQAIECPTLQSYDALQRPGNYPAAVAACAKKLGVAANAFGSAAVGNDLAAILKALDIRHVDVYGDSYGSYAAQVFTLHHPSLVRALVLDGTYNESYNPFEPEAVGALRRAWTTLCERSAGCGTSGSGSGILARIAAFARTVARHPLTGISDGSTGPPVHVVITAPSFGQMVFDATYSYTVFRDLPGALEALRNGDERPMLRLGAEDMELNAAGGSAAGYSAGDLQAVSCHDYPTAWNVAASPSQRRVQLAAAISGLPRGVFSPFSKTVWLASLDENELVTGCLDWPKPAISDPPFPKGLAYPDLPVLILDGQFDQATPVADALKVAHSWPDNTFVEVANSGHVTGQDDYLGCTSTILRRFISTLRAGNISCASRIPPVYVVPDFPPRLAEAPSDLARPATAADSSTPTDRRATWVAGETVGDALSRWFNLVVTRGHELYGGTFQVSGAYYSLRPVRLTFSDSRFTSDLAVSGSAVWNRRTSVVTAALQLRGPSGTHGEGTALGSIRLSWSANAPNSLAHATGSLGGHTISLEMAAPWSTSP